VPSRTKRLPTDQALQASSRSAAPEEWTYTSQVSSFRFITTTFIAICLAMYFAAVRNGDGTPLPEWRSLSPGMIGTTTFWRWLLPSAVAHSSPAHLLMNMAAFIPLSVHFERRFGPLSTAALVITAAGLASTAQLLFGGHGDIGSSGVVFAFAGFIAVFPERRGKVSNRILDIFVCLLLAWFVYGFLANALWATSYGNASHACGLILGALCGGISRFTFDGPGGEQPSG
jgi:membrane associated rhomboid family serine protease